MSGHSQDNLQLNHMANLAKDGKGDLKPQEKIK